MSQNEDITVFRCMQGERTSHAANVRPCQLTGRLPSSLCCMLSTSKIWGSVFIRLGSGGFPVSFVDSVLAMLSAELLSSPAVTSCDSGSSISYVIKIKCKAQLHLGERESWSLSSLIPEMFGIW